MEAIPRTPRRGDCDPRFASVREAFDGNFATRGEIGAALCVHAGGRRVVDLWGGHRDEARTRPWRPDTLVNVYSVGKGVAATLALRLVAAGRLDLDAPAIDLWPELGAQGKSELTLRMLLAHRAGLPAVRAPLAEGAMLDWRTLCDALASQAPWWPPGSAHGYHCNTFGFLVGELVRRATGLGFGAALRRHLTGPLDADFHVGLPAALHGRVAPVHGPAARSVPPDRAARFLARSGDPEIDAMRRATYFNPAGLSGMGVVNTRAWREAEIPSTNGHATARAVATLYDATLGRGPAPLPRALRDEARRTHSEGEDLVLGRRSRFGLGYQLPLPERPLGPGAGSYGHYGHGGTLGFADPQADLAFGYVMNRPGDRWQEARTRALVDAVCACL